MNDVIVLQMGKVGSRSVQLALHEAGVMALHKHGYHRIKEPDPTDKIITLVRDPVARNFSGYFASLKNFIDPKVWPKTTVEDFITVFVEEYPHDGYLTWFENKIEATIGFDVYAHNFDPKKGYMIVDNFLLFRIEDFDKKGTRIIKEFLGEDVNLKPRRSNVLPTIHKGAGPHYTEVKKHGKMPKEFLDKMYTSRYATYFYTSDEIKEFRKKWGKSYG